MKLKKKINTDLNRLPIQVVLLVLIVVAMAEFISVSFIIINLMKELNIDIRDEMIQMFMIKIVVINVSMILLFAVIVLLVSRVFKMINNCFFSLLNCARANLRSWCNAKPHGLIVNSHLSPKYLRLKSL